MFSVACNVVCCPGMGCIFCRASFGVLILALPQFARVHDLELQVRSPTATVVDWAEAYCMGSPSGLRLSRFSCCMGPVNELTSLHSLQQLAWLPCFELDLLYAANCSLRNFESSILALACRIARRPERIAGATDRSPAWHPSGPVPPPGPPHRNSVEGAPQAPVEKKVESGGRCLGVWVCVHDRVGATANSADPLALARGQACGRWISFGF
jgi:hypothetical protein